MAIETKIFNVLKSDSDKIAEVKALMERIQSNRSALEKQWYVNIAFLFGKQYFKVKKGTTLGDRIWYALERIEKGKKERRVSNKILVYFRSLLSRLLKMKARVKVDPETRMRRDVDAAQVAVEVLEDFWHRVNRNNPYLADKLSGMQMVLKYLFAYILSFGKGYLKPYFNPNTVASTLSEGEIIQRQIGEVEVDVRHSLDTYKDPLKRFIIEKDIVSTDFIYDRYDVEVEPEDVFISEIEKQLLSLIDKTDYKNLEEAVTLYQFWRLPCRKYPRGRLFVFTDKTIIFDDDLPQEYGGKLPFFEFTWFDLAFSSFYQSLIEQLIPLQQEYNHTITRIAEYKKYLAGKLLVPDGANLQTKWTDETGQIIKYKRGFEPHYHFPPNPPAFLFQDLARIEKDMQDIAMSHDPTLARVPVGVKSGVAIERLQEKDDFSLTPYTIEFEEKLGFFADMVLDIMATKYTEERILQTAGKDKGDEVKTFMGHDIKGNRRVMVSLGSELPVSRGVRKQEIIELFKAGLIGRDEAKRYLPLGDVESALEDIDTIAAKSENEEMSKGEVILPQEWENHKIHLEIHREFMANPKFRELLPEIRAIFVNHYQETAKLLSEEIKGGEGG